MLYAEIWLLRSTPATIKSKLIIIIIILEYFSGTTGAIIFRLGNGTYTDYIIFIHTPVGGEGTADGSIAHHNIHLF